MPNGFFVFAILALLLTPGPTNTLLTVGAAARGWRASLPLLFGELAGYLVVVVPPAVVVVCCVWAACCASSAARSFSSLGFT